MSSVPARYRGVASGMRSTFQNSGTALSIGVFFSLMIARAGEQSPESTDQRPATARRAAGHRAPGEHAAAGVLAVRGSSRREPAAAPAGGESGAVRTSGCGSADHHRPGVLPGPDFRAVSPRPGRGVRRSRRPGGACRCRVAVARRPQRRSNGHGRARIGIWPAHPARTQAAARSPERAGSRRLSRARCASLEFGQDLRVPRRRGCPIQRGDDHGRP